MSILIKGIKMPKGCRDCKLLHCWDDERYKCPFLPYLQWVEFEDVPSYIASEDCPIVEVPEPHGRLIDADALSKKAYHRQTLTTVADMLNDINDAPTVIEAEGK